MPDVPGAPDVSVAPPPLGLGFDGSSSGRALAGGRTPEPPADSRPGLPPLASDELDPKPPSQGLFSEPLAEPFPRVRGGSGHSALDPGPDSASGPGPAFGPGEPQETVAKIRLERAVGVVFMMPSRPLQASVSCWSVLSRGLSPQGSGLRAVILLGPEFHGGQLYFICPAHRGAPRERGLGYDRHRAFAD